MSSTTHTVQEAVRRVADVFTRTPERRGLFPCAADALNSRVPSDASLWFALDPITFLPTLPTHGDRLAPGLPAASWLTEFDTQDVLLFADLARSPHPADSLQRATGQSPERSARYRLSLAPAGIGDELRAVFRVAGTVWGGVALFRAASAPAFTATDCAAVAAVGPVIAEALRARAAQGLVAASGAPGPGTALFCREGRLVSLDDDAAAWLERIAGREWNAADPPTDRVAVTAVVARANAVGLGRARGHSLARLRLDDGDWAVLRSNPTWTPQGEPGPTSLIIDRARPSQLVTLRCGAHGLTAREGEIVEAIGQGYSNEQIGRRVHLSAHTVRDHLTSIFDKVGVATRGELAARLFCEGEERER